MVGRALNRNFLEGRHKGASARVGGPAGPIARRGRDSRAERDNGFRVQRDAGGGKRERAGLPEPKELLQPAENARQAGHDQSVHRVRQPGTRLLRPEGVVELGQLVGQRGRLN